MTDAPDKLVADLREESRLSQRSAWEQADGGQVYCIAAQLADAAADRIETQAARIAELEAEVAEARRRRDAWKAKADEIETLRRALREKVGDPPPPNMSRLLWAAVAADERMRRQAADSRIAELEAALERIAAMDRRVNYRCGDLSRPMHVDGPIGKIARAALAADSGAASPTSEN